MAEGDLAGFGPHNLAFGKDELRGAINKALGIDLADDELDTLAEELEGVDYRRSAITLGWS